MSGGRQLAKQALRLGEIAAAPGAITQIIGPTGDEAGDQADADILQKVSRCFEARGMLRQHGKSFGEDGADPISRAPGLLNNKETSRQVGG